MAKQTGQYLSGPDFYKLFNTEGTKLLAQFRETLDTKKQKQLVYQMEKIFLNDMPFISLFVGPRWSTYSTKFFVGWPNEKAQYADPIFTQYPDVSVVLTRVRPAK